MDKTIVGVKETPDEDEPIVKRRPGNRFKTLINAEDYDPQSMANYADKVKFVKRGGKEYIKIKGRFSQNSIPKEAEKKPVETKI